MHSETHILGTALPISSVEGAKAPPGEYASRLGGVLVRFPSLGISSATAQVYTHHIDWQVVELKRSKGARS